MDRKDVLKVIKSLQEKPFVISEDEIKTDKYVITKLGYISALNNKDKQLSSFKPVKCKNCKYFNDNPDYAYTYCEYHERETIFDNYCSDAEIKN